MPPEQPPEPSGIDRLGRELVHIVTRMMTKRPTNPQVFPSRLRDRTPLLVGVVVIPLAASCAFALLPQVQRTADHQQNQQRHHTEWRATSSDRERREDGTASIDRCSFWGQDQQEPQESPLRRVTAWLEPRQEPTPASAQKLSPPPPRPKAGALLSPPTAGRAPPHAS